jgi:hypothetical protein
MKRLLLLILLLLLTSIAYCQQLHLIKFTYWGDQTHPHGSLYICVEKQIPLSGKSDALFGHSFKTDIKTFNCICNFITTTKYTALYEDDTMGNGFKINLSNGKVYYLYGRNCGAFSHQLQSILKQQNLDKRLIDVFNIY